MTSKRSSTLAAASKIHMVDCPSLHGPCRLQKQEAFFGISGSLLSKKSGCVEYLRAAKATAD
jgi:hypothetical protein